MTGGEQIVRTVRRVLLSVLVMAFCAVFLELASRLVHRWKAPLLPYSFVRGAALLPPGMDLEASFYGLPANRYITDDWGARIADPAVAAERPGQGIFVIGDSQVLGYMLEFDDTFASKVAQAALGDRRRARILAAPADHPETYAEALDAYAPQGLERQRLAVLGLNLGNDLDEMYSEALDWQRESSHGLGRWLSIHSFVYMDWVLFRSHTLQLPEEPLGVNRILYMLASDERIILGREVARTLDEVIRSRVVADRVLVLIVPTDLQVDPKEFAKYRRYYHSDEEFERWSVNAPEYSAMMNALETYIASQLERRGIEVLRLTSLVETDGHAESLFDRTSHHLTSRSHGLIARAILAPAAPKP